jgi:hypothetical protein
MNEPMIGPRAQASMGTELARHPESAVRATAAAVFRIQAFHGQLRPAARWRSPRLRE